MTKLEFGGVTLSVHAVTVDKVLVNKRVKPSLLIPEEQRSGWTESGWCGPTFERKGKHCSP